MSKGEVLIILAILGSLSLGLLVGYFIRGKNISLVGRVITVLIWTLLFCLGVKVGTDEKVVAELPNIGFEALMITLGAVSGSLFFAWLLWRFVTKRNIG